MGGFVLLVGVVVALATVSEGDGGMSMINFLAVDAADITSSSALVISSEVSSIQVLSMFLLACSIMTLRVSSMSSAGEEYSARVDRSGCEGMTVNALMVEANATVANAVLVIIMGVGYWQMNELINVRNWKL